MPWIYFHERFIKIFTMKKIIKLIYVGLIVFALSFTNVVKGQGTTGNKVSFTAGADIYSSYVWRGTKFAGPSIQPTVAMNAGNFSIGVWGSYGTAVPGGGPYYETDPYLSYSFKMGLSLGFTAYYYEGDYTKVSDTTSSFAYEVNVGYTIKSLSLSANYVLNDSRAGAGSQGGDTYLQATYNFPKFNLFLGAGNGWYTMDHNFAVCNVGIGTSKTIEVTSKFSIPVTGQVIVNPDKKQLFMVVGFSL